TMSRFRTAAGWRRLWVGLAAACLIGGVLALAVFRPLAPVDRGFKDADLSNAQTEVEVVALLGPPGNYSTREHVYMGFHSGPFPKGRVVTWRDDCAEVIVYFAPEGYWTYYRIDRAVPARRSWVDHLRDLWDAL